MKEFDFYFTVPCSFSYVIKAKSEKEARKIINWRLRR